MCLTLAAAVTSTQCMFKEHIDKKLKLFYGIVNYELIIYFIFIVFIKLTCSMKNYSPLLKL